MRELTIRIEIIAYACDGNLNLTPPYVREYSYLQYRRICELIALGCLHLHGDLPAAKAKTAKKEWNADRIMSLLHRNHPHSFPQSVTQTEQNGIKHLHANSKPNALTLGEFKTLYNECGEILHRGTIKSIEIERPIIKSDYDKVMKWHNKIVDLMNQHIIVRKNGNSFYLVSLKSKNGLPAVSIFHNFSNDKGTVKVETFGLNAEGRSGG